MGQGVSSCDVSRVHGGFRPLEPGWRQRPGVPDAGLGKAQATRWRFNRRGVVTVRSHAYIRPSLGNAIATGSAGAARLLLSSARFVSFRAPIDSVMDPGGRPRRPKDSSLSFRHGLGRFEKAENEAVDSGVLLQ